MVAGEDGGFETYCWVNAEHARTRFSGTATTGGATDADAPTCNWTTASLIVCLTSIVIVAEFMAFCIDPWSSVYPGKRLEYLPVKVRVARGHRRLVCLN